MFACILITRLLDIVLILLGEILSWSLMGVEGLKTVANSQDPKCFKKRIQNLSFRS